MKIHVLVLVCTIVSGQDQGSRSATEPVKVAKPPEKKEIVVVTGTYDPVPLQEADRDVNVIPLDSIQKLLSNTVFDLLRLDTSLDVRSRGANGIQTDVSIHGGNFGQTLVLLDGIRMNDAQTGHFDLDIPIPPDAIGRAEILAGAGSAIYGSDAVGGAINLITAAPESSELHLRAAMGSFGTNQESGSLSLA